MFLRKMLTIIYTSIKQKLSTPLRSIENPYKNVVNYSNELKNNGDTKGSQKNTMYFKIFQSYENFVDGIFSFIKK